VSAIRFYCDEDSQNRALMKALPSRGVEVPSAGEAGLLGQNDEAQLAWANMNNCLEFLSNWT